MFENVWNRIGVDPGVFWKPEMFERFERFTRFESFESGFNHFQTFSNIFKHFQTFKTRWRAWKCLECWKMFGKVWTCLNPDSNLSDLSNLSNLSNISGIPERPPEVIVGSVKPMYPENVWKCLDMSENGWIRLGGGWPRGLFWKPEMFEKFQSLASRKRCDIEIAKTLRFFFIADKETLRFFFDWKLGHLKLGFSLLPETGRQIWHHQWVFSNNKRHYCFLKPTSHSFRSFECEIGLQKLSSPLPANARPDLHRSETKKTTNRKNVAIWNLRFRNAAICDFIPRFFCDVSAEPAVRVAILNLRFENASDCDCNLLGR